YRPLQRRVATPVAFSSVQRKPNTAIQRKSAATPSPTIARTRPVHIPPVYRPQSVLLPRSADANATSRRRANQTVPPPLLTRPVQFSRAGAIQRALTPTGQNYLNNITTGGNWGGEPEAHAIASRYQFTTNIFRVDSTGRLRLVATVGAGAERPFSLYWNGVHYDVLAGNGAALNGQVFTQALVAHASVGNGDCLYEAMFFILRMGDAKIGEALREDPIRRASEVGNMRKAAAASLDPALANILGEELQIYAEKSPGEHYLAYDVKKGEFFFYDRSNNQKKESLTSILKKLQLETKGKGSIAERLGKAQWYWSEKAWDKLFEQPLVPVIAPTIEPLEAFHRYTEKLKGSNDPQSVLGHLTVTGAASIEVGWEFDKGVNYQTGADDQLAGQIARIRAPENTSKDGEVSILVKALQHFTIQMQKG